MASINLRMILLLSFASLSFLLGNFSHVMGSPCSTVLWIVLSPVSGKCPEGSSLLQGCQRPTSKPSKCSCLKQKVVQTPCLMPPSLP